MGVCLYGIGINVLNFNIFKMRLNNNIKTLKKKNLNSSEKY